MLYTFSETLNYNYDLLIDKINKKKRIDTYMFIIIFYNYKKINGIIYRCHSITNYK